MNDWQPIETAPEQTAILVIPFGDVDETQVSWWMPSEDRWANWHWSAAPTHWMPLPEPPK